MSSLATQLAQNVSLNASLLVDRSRRKPATSYLFTGREADQHDLEAIHALGANALLQLSSVCPALEKYEDVLFSERAKDTDRTLLPIAQVEELDKAIEEFLWLLSPYLMEPSAGKILEYLVKRFRINEFNLEATLSLFLPYHESPHFAKMLSILSLKPNSTWSFLIPYKSAAQNLPRVSLVTEMLKNSEIARFVTSLLPTAIKKGIGHRVLFAFNAATLQEFIKRSKSLSEGTMAYLLPALLEPLQQTGKKLWKDSVLGSYILLATLSVKCEWSPPAFRTVIGVMSTCASTVQGGQFIRSLVAVCGTQPELESFTDSTVKVILSLTDVNEELASCSGWEGSEKVLSPLVRGLCERLENLTASSLLETIIATQTTPLSVIEALSCSLLQVSLKMDAETQNSLNSRRLLALVQQRQPDLVRKVVDTFADNSPSLKNFIDQLVISISTIGQLHVTPELQEGNNMILASADADPNVRVMAVKELAKAIEGKALESIGNMETVRGILMARLQDTNSAVLEALYANASAVTPIFASEPKTYLTSLSSVVDSEVKPKRNVLRLHLAYLTTSFWKAVEPSIQEEVFHRIFFPLLLFSKPRQKTAELVWDTLRELSGNEYIEWLVDCPSLIKPVANSETSASTDSMNEINYDIADKIAENIAKSTRFSEHLDALLVKLQDPRPHSKLMGYLICISLMRQLTGSRQIETASKILKSINLTALSGIDDFSQEHLALSSVKDRSLGKYIVAKPNSKITVHWLEISLVAALSQTTRPSNIVLDWIADSSSQSEEEGYQYVHLMRTLYQVTNASTSVPVLSTTLLQLLFVNLKGDALAFLAGIWASSKVDEFMDSRGISLLHAAAFLEAHILEDDGVDFQTILPTLLVALLSSDTQICQGAIECISRVRILAERNLSSVYRFDTIYGQNERTLQYLDQDDLKRYLNGLVEHRDHFANDHSYLKVFHDYHLARNKGDKKRDADYKHRIVCYLLSHINALTSHTIQDSLLTSIATITSKSKTQILLPTIQVLVDKASSLEPAAIFPAISEDFTTRVLSCYDSTAAAYLNETAQAWETFAQLLRTFFRSGTPLQPQEALAHAIENGLFSSLTQPRKSTLCEILLDVGSQDTSSQSLARRVLSAVLVDVPLIVHLLELLTPLGPTSSPRVTKRAKTTESSDDVLPRLSLLVEVLGTKSLPGSLDLISNLLDTLSKIVQVMPAGQADVSYIEQLLMSAVESAASKITEVPNISPSVIRLDILVEVIRVSGNPQTFNQALLLISNLARLAPESVLYNVMPVFTFMGSNVFHRDDSYSFKVVQQTIDGIVPVMVSSLRKTHSQPLDLYLASKEFLRVFSDAANHIPRHRRNKFFGHLVHVLGARDFLAPVCMLLLEKMANRIIRQPSEEVQNSLSLPISVFQHFDYALQLHTASEILQESRRIVAHIADPLSMQPIFLEGITDGDHSVSASTILKRRAQALVIFVGYALKPKTLASPTANDETPIASVISQLIALATLPEIVSNETKIEDVSEAARLTMNRLLIAMSVLDFSEAVQSMLDSGDVKVQVGALDLLAKRLPDVSAKMRPVLTGSLIKTMISIKNIISIHKQGQVVVNAFNALKSIASTISPGEESSLTDAVPLAISATKENSLALSALGALSAMSVKLGPRIIPFFRAIITQSITILRGEDSVLFQDSFAVLQGLLSTIPTFWGSGEVNQVVFLYMDQASSTSKPLSGSLSTLTRSIAKRIPTKVLMPTLLEMWQPLQASKKLARISAYFAVFSRATQHADRPTVLEHLRTSFKIFLEALDVVKVDVDVEASVISAFKELVVKLNETAFKPLFRRLFDWAFVENTTDIARKVTFGHLYISLLDYFKGLMVPYMSFLLQPFSDTLSTFTTSTSDNFALWSSIVQTLTRTFNHDDAGFWRDDKIRQISTPLTAQIEVCVRLGYVDGKRQLKDALSALIETANDDTLLKSVNQALLMHTRSEDHRVRLFALTCAEALWRANGGKLLGFVGETATFISECSEDENDVVVKECFKLKDAVESVAGTIDGL